MDTSYLISYQSSQGTRSPTKPLWRFTRILDTRAAHPWQQSESDQTPRHSPSLTQDPNKHFTASVCPWHTNHGLLLPPHQCQELVDTLVDDQLAINNMVEKGFGTPAVLANVRELSDHFVLNTGPVELIRERTRCPGIGQNPLEVCKKALRCGKWLETRRTYPGFQINSRKRFLSNILYIYYYLKYHRSRARRDVQAIKYRSALPPVTCNNAKEPVSIPMESVTGHSLMNLS